VLVQLLILSSIVPLANGDFHFWGWYCRLEEFSALDLSFLISTLVYLLSYIDADSVVYTKSQGSHYSFLIRDLLDFLKLFNESPD